MIAKISERNKEFIKTLAYFFMNFLIVYNVGDYSPNLILVISFNIPRIKILNKYT